MNKDTAKRLVQETLQNSFDKERFTYFVRNLLNHIKETPQTIYRGNFIPDAYKPYIKTLDRIGKYEDPEKHKIDILIVRLRKQISLERARTMQRNFVAWYLNGSRGGVLKDAALVAFVSPDKDDWRFSFVKMEYKLAETLKGNIKAKEQLTPARRYSFLVGKNETSHTAQSQFVPILVEDDHNPTLKQIEDAFGIEKVTKEFFEKYRELFLRLKEALEKIVKKDKNIKSDFEAKNVDTVDFAKKLLGQIVFLYFLQKKGWFGVARDADWGTGPKNFQRQLFDEETAKGKNFFNDSLELLFYEALAVERTDDFYGKFNCKIPFLNGGLFDPINNYDWVHTDILLPNELFSNTEKTKQGDTGTGILDVFDRYNFTVKEDEPLEKEVAVDPEMLGKVFENLLEVKDRKSKGTYYTPREIVHYMCQQSLINYLDTAVNTGKKKTIAPEKPKQNKFFGEPEHQQMSLHSSEPIVPQEDITSLILHGQSALEHDTRVENKGRETKRYPFQMPETIRENVAAIDKALESIRICDPAVGSGAFLVGMMHEIVNARQVLSTYLDGSKNRTPYDFKRYAIQNCLYGVDIDLGAVEIAKLRLWLSLVVDEEEREKIKPLPNLDYKIVCGNSLIGVPRTLENWKDFAELERLKPLFFNETNARKKQDYKNQIDQTIAKITNGHTDFDFEIYFSEVFHEKSGFDVVIANPPYVKEAVNKNAFDGLRKSECYQGKMDLWYLFGSKGLDVLKKNGIMCFIATNNWVSNDGASKFRNKVITQGRIINFVDFRNYKVFAAGIQTMVFLILKQSEPHEYISNYAELKNDKADGDILADFLREAGETSNPEYVRFPVRFKRSDYKDQYINFVPPAIDSILNKLKSAGPFHILTNEIFSGIDVMQDFVNRKHLVKLGDKFSVGDGIFVLNNSKKNRINWNTEEQNLIKPYYTTREVSRYYGNSSNRYWIIYTHPQINEAIGDYPNIKKHLDKFQKVITSVNKPYGLHRTRDEDIFIGEKILSIRKCSQPSFSFVDFPCYVSRAFLIIKTDRIALKYLLALLNSRLTSFWLLYKGKLQGNLFQVDKVPLMNIPILKADPNQQKALIDVVNKILDITMNEDYLDNPASQSKVKELEKQIDQMVYKLYGLTDEEIAIVEGSDNKKQNNKG